MREQMFITKPNCHEIIRNLVKMILLLRKEFVKDMNKRDLSLIPMNIDLVTVAVESEPVKEVSRIATKPVKLIAFFDSRASAPAAPVAPAHQSDASH